MKRLCSIDTFKFIMALIIVIFHCIERLGYGKYFIWGRLATDIFFIISGFFLAKTYEKSETSEDTDIKKSQVYFVSRIIRLWPEYIFALIFVALLYKIFLNSFVGEALIFNSIMMIGWGGISSISVYFWYVAVLFWGGCFLYNILIFGKDKAKAIFIPTLAILCLFYLINHRGVIGGVSEINFGLISSGTIRGFLGMAVGILTYWCCQSLEKNKQMVNPKLIPYILFGGEIVSFIGLFYILIFQSTYNNNLFNMYFYSAFLIGLLYFKKEKLLKCLSWKIWIPLSKVSYMLYLIHLGIINVLSVHYKPWFLDNLLFGIVLIVTCSVFLAFIFHYASKALFSKLKDLFIKKT